MPSARQSRAIQVRYSNLPVATLAEREEKDMPAIERLMLDSQPEPVSHYCHVTKAGNLIWVSGTVGIGSDGTIPNDVVEQFELAIANMDSSLRQSVPARSTS